MHTQTNHDMKRTYLHNNAANRSSHVNIWLVVPDHLQWQLYCTAKKQTTGTLPRQSQSGFKHVGTECLTATRPH